MSASKSQQGPLTNLFTWQSIAVVALSNQATNARVIATNPSAASSPEVVVGTVTVSSGRQFPGFSWLWLVLILVAFGSGMLVEHRRRRRVIRITSKQYGNP
jgi:hypothetical protein